jgi:hypothetical protein
MYFEYQPQLSAIETLRSIKKERRGERVGRDSSISIGLSGCRQDRYLCCMTTLRQGHVDKEGRKGMNNEYLCHGEPMGRICIGTASHIDLIELLVLLLALFPGL